MTAQTASAAVTFPAVPVSAREARRFLRVFLDSSALDDDFVQSAELALSEVVTNAVLHAHTDFDVALTLDGYRLRVEVRDRNPQTPVQRSYGENATTGRGMHLVAAYTRDCGVDADTDGKTVWFVMDAAAGQEQSEQDLLDSWAVDLDDDPLGAAPTADNQDTVVLIALPPTLWLAAREHHDAVIRELALYTAEHPDGTPGAERIALADRARAWISTRVVAELDRLDTAGAGRRWIDAPAAPAPQERPEDI